MRLLALAATFCGVLALHAKTANADNNGLFHVVSYRINHTSESKSWRELYEECKGIDNCAAGIEAAAQYFGTSTNEIDSAIGDDPLAAKVPGVRNVGEEYYLDIDAPPGYFLCQGYLKVFSTVPLEGRRTPTLDITMEYEGLKSYAFVHKLAFTKGRSWVDSVYTAKYMRYSQRNSPEAAKCWYGSGKKVRYVCKGAECQADGPIK